MESDLEYPLPRIPYLNLQLELVSQEDTRLPSFKGSVLHGAFGNSLRRTVCVMGPKQPCDSCFLNRQCINTKIFETLIFQEAPRFLKGLKTSPRPFTFFCPDETRDFKAGDSLTFEMRLIGQTGEYHPYIIFAVQRMAEKGLGSRRGKFKLKEVLMETAAGKWERLYDGASQKLLGAPRTLIAPPSDKPENIESLTLRFLTPTRLKVDRELTTDFNFRQLLFRLLRRSLELAYFYVPGIEIEWEFHDLLVAANKVEITRRDLAWKELNRYSSRQKAEMLLGGFVGELDLQGNLAPFMPILRASEALHVGKATTFGLGRMEVVEK